MPDQAACCPADGAPLALYWERDLDGLAWCPSCARALLTRYCGMRGWSVLAEVGYSPYRGAYRVARHFDPRPPPLPAGALPPPPGPQRRRPVGDGRRLRPLRSHGGPWQLELGALLIAPVPVLVLLACARAFAGGAGPLLGYVALAVLTALATVVALAPDRRDEA